MRTISPTELQQILADKSNVSLLDVRTPVEFAEVRVPGARNVPLDQLRPSALLALGQLKKDEPVYVLCRSGARAQKAAEKLYYEGIHDPVVVQGGTLAWIEAGLRVERSAVKVISLERQVRIVAGALVFIGVALGWFVHPGFFGMAAFVGAGLVFAGISDFCGMGLLLARMPWNNRNPIQNDPPLAQSSAPTK